METGEISKKTYTDYFLAGGNLCSLVFLALIFAMAQIAVSGSDYWVSYWTNQETLRAVLHSKNSSYYNITYSDTENSYQDQSGYLAKSQWFDGFGLFQQTMSIHIYTFCIAGTILFTTLRSTLFMRTCMNASRNIHDSMFMNLMQATMRFFNTNPTGMLNLL